MYDYWYDEIDNLITEAKDCINEMALYEQCIDEIVRKKVIRGKKAVIKSSVNQLHKNKLVVGVQLGARKKE